MKKIFFILILFCSIQGFGQIKGYWRFNGNSNDASGNGNNGSNTSIIFSQDNGRLNQGAGFNGTTSKIVMTSTATLKPTSIYTMSVWIKTTNTVSYPFIFQSSRRGTTVYYGIEMILQATDGRVYAPTYRGTGTVRGTDWQYAMCSSSCNDGKWHNIVATYDGSYLRIYFDGKLDATPVAWINNPVYNPTTNYATIGSSYQDGISAYAAFWNGSIDEMILDNTAWSPAKVKNYYLATSANYSFAGQNSDNIALLITITVIILTILLLIKIFR